MTAVKFHTTQAIFRYGSTNTRTPVIAVFSKSLKIFFCNNQLLLHKFLNQTPTGQLFPRILHKQQGRMPEDNHLIPELSFHINIITVLRLIFREINDIFNSFNDSETYKTDKNWA